MDSRPLFARLDGTDPALANDTANSPATSIAQPHRETPMLFDAWRGAGIGTEADSTGALVNVWNDAGCPDLRGLGAARPNLGFTDAFEYHLRCAQAASRLRDDSDRLRRLRAENDDSGEALADWNNRDRGDT